MVRQLPNMLRDLLLVRVPKVSKTEGGIALPENAARERITRAGTVVAAGGECEVPVGAAIYYNMIVGQELKDDRISEEDNKYLIISENDVYCYYKEDK